MKVWIDLDNSPHVLFFAPIIRQLERDGAEVLITARSFSQTEELADSHGLTFTTVGHHRTPRNFAARVTATLLRARQLRRHVQPFRPDVAISHGSRALVLAAWVLGVPTLTLYDYEFISARVLNQLSSQVMAPSVVEPESLRRQGLDMRKFIPYPGLKEEVYIYDLQPDRAVLKELNLDPERVIVTIRPPAEWAHYYSEQSEVLFRTLVERLRREELAQIVVLPRTREQGSALAAKYSMSTKPFQMAERAVDALSLIWHSDIVFSGGGTMVREAALLGIDVYSIFAGKLGAADQALAAAGKLRLLRQAAEIEQLSFSKRTNIPSRSGGSRETRDFVYRQILEFARTRGHGSRAAAVGA